MAKQHSVSREDITQSEQFIGRFDRFIKGTLFVDVGGHTKKLDKSNGHLAQLVNEILKRYQDTIAIARAMARAGNTTIDDPEVYEAVQVVIAVGDYLRDPSDTNKRALHEVEELLDSKYGSRMLAMGILQGVGIGVAVSAVVASFLDLNLPLGHASAVLCGIGIIGALISTAALMYECFSESMSAYNSVRSLSSMKFDSNDGITFDEAATVRSVGINL